MQPPRPRPSKHWWNIKAIKRAFAASGLCEAPSEIPIITECTIIPNSNTYFEFQNKIKHMNVNSEVISNVTLNK